MARLGRTRFLSATLWLVALLLAMVLGFFQRRTGPSYPVTGSVEVGDEAIRYRLPRSHGGAGGLPVRLMTADAASTGAVCWRHFPSDEPFLRVPMSRLPGGSLEAEIPHQPPAGKVEYWVEVELGGRSARLPASGTAVARFRGEVPAAVLVPHILAMFTSMLLATRALLEVLRPSRPRPYRLILGSMALLTIGGLLLGPIVQRYAFGALWTGWPLGHDLTDNKTLLAVAAWLPATVLSLRRRAVAAAVMLGWLVMMGVFLIPHSVRGSQLDWAATPTLPAAPSPAVR